MKTHVVLDLELSGKVLAACKGFVQHGELTKRNATSRGHFICSPTGL